MAPLRCRSIDYCDRVVEAINSLAWPASWILAAFAVLRFGGLQPRIVAEAPGRATVRVAFFRASNRSRALRMAGQFD